MNDAEDVSPHDLLPDVSVTPPAPAALVATRLLPWPEIAAVLTRPLLFDEWRQESSHIALVRRPSSVPSCLWFIGDVHGDLLALDHAWRYVQEQAAQAGQTPHVMLLGDLIDRGPHSHETLLYLFHLIHDFPQQVGVLAGNHDADLSWDGTRFQSNVQPAEYAEELNSLLGKDDADSQLRVEVGRQTTAFFQRLPRAVVLPDGLLITHGGFPHVDLLDRLEDSADLSRPECLQDFTWLRLSENPRKKPNRTHRGCEFGVEDFARFCEWTAERLGLSVNRMVRGHDHVAERFQVHAPYGGHPVLTLNSMCRRLADEWLEGDAPMGCVARYVPGQLPEVHRIAERGAKVGSTLACASG